MRCHYPGLGSASDWVVNASTKKHYPDLARTSSVWNVCAHALGPVHSLLLRRFVFRMAEASAKRVSGDEPQGTMGRVQTAGEATSRPLSPSPLPLRAHFHQKRDVSGYEAAPSTLIRIFLNPQLFLSRY